MRKIEFSDGFSSSTAPALGELPANQYQQFANDAAFVTDKGSAAAKGDIYFNTTFTCIRFYDGTDWQNVATETLLQSEVADLEAAIAATESDLSGDINSVANDLSSHLADSADSHDASAISNVPAGNLSATNVQSALDELQTDVDTRATSTDLSDHAALTETHGATGAIVGTTNTQTLTNKTLVSPVVDTIVLDDQASTPTNPSAGYYKMYAKANGKVYKLDSAGTEQEIGAGGSGGKNYAQDLFSGDSIAGINVYTDAAAATPVDGTGGAGTGLTVTVNASSPLRGIANQRMSKDASNRQGGGWSFDFTADRADYEGGKPIIISFKYKTSANYVASDVRCFVYDKDGTTLLNLVSLNGDGSIPAASTSALFTGVFHPNPSNDDYRLIFHIAGTTATAYDIDLIDLKIGPNQVVPGAIIANLGTETWVDDQANATTSVRVTRIGNRVFLDGKTSFTGVASSTLEITVPAAYTPDVGTYGTISSTNFVKVGLSEIVDVSAFATYAGDAVLGASQNNLYIFWYNAGGSTAIESNITSTTPMTWASGDVINWSANWVVEGWSTSAAMSTTEALFSAAKFNAVKNGDQAIGSAANVKVTGWTVSTDNLGWWDATNNRYVVKKKGRYTVAAAVELNALTTGQVFQIIVYVNGAFVTGSYDVASSTTEQLSISVPLELNANDYIEIYVDSGGDTAYNVLGNAYSYFTVTANPDLSTFSVYGQFEVLTTTSSVKTPAASNRFSDMVGNSLTLTPGTWELTGVISQGVSGSPAYTFIGGGYYGANGGDSASVPALMTTLPGLTMLSFHPESINSGLGTYVGAASSNGGVALPTEIVRVSQTTTIYVVPYATMGTAANARLTASMTAKRLQ